MSKTNSEKKIYLEEYLQDAARKFIDRETAGGVLLIICMVIALVLANSPLSESYHHFWEIQVSLQIDRYKFSEPLHFLVNDGLMVIFFFVVGLEIKREFYAGYLSDFKKATLPMFAALGGMVVPAGIYIIFNAGTENSNGWGVPIATDIAFSLGIISLLGKRIPLSVKVFLTALAIVDDIGAVMVIAIFYSTDISWLYIGICGGIVLLSFALNKLKVNNSYIFLVVGICLWLMFLQTGIHPTLTGVLLAFTIPIKPRMGDKDFEELSKGHLSQFNEVKHPEKSVVENKPQLKVIEGIRKITKKFNPMAVRLESRLEGLNSFFVMPVFALANAGVTFGKGWSDVLFEPLGLGIFLGLAVGKAGGISLFSWLALKTKISHMPDGGSFSGIIGIGFMAGIGFTMSLFISNLAFENDVLSDAKIAVLVASFVAAIIGYIYLRLIYRNKPNEKSEGDSGNQRV